MHLNLHIQLLQKSLISLTVATMTWLTAMEYICHKWPRYVPLVVNTSRSFPHPWLITGFVTRLTRRMSLVDQGLLTPPEHMRSPPVLVGFVLLDMLCVCFVDRCLFFCTFSFGHCVIYVFWLPLWYLQSLLRFLFVVRFTWYSLRCVSSLWQTSGYLLYH
jgi:hypothetical protein